MNDLNLGSWLRLFVNDFTPGPGTNLTGFQQPSWAGYAPITLTTQWGAPVKTFDGQYSSTLPQQEFPPPPAGVTIVYGAYITWTTEWVLATRFGAAVQMGPTDPGLQVDWILETFSRSILP